MARKGLFKEIPSPDDELLQRLQKNIKDVVETLTADDDILRVPVTVMVVTGAIPAGKSVVVFTGAANQKLTLPLANSQGAAVSSVSLVVNTSGNALTVIPAASNTINGILTLAVAPGVAVLLTSDGQTKWIAISGPGGAGGGGGALSVSAGTSSAALSSVVFSNSNGISFGLNGSTITASQAQAFSAAGGSSTFQTLVFTNSNGVSFSNTLGSVWASVAAQTNQQETLFAAGNTTKSTSGTWNASSLVFGASGGLSVGITGGSVLYSAVPNFTKSRFNPFMEAAGLASQVGSNTLQFHPVPDPDNFQFNRMLFDITVAQTGTTGQAGLTISMWAGIYTRNVSTLSLLASQSTSQGFTASSTNSSIHNGARLFSMGWTSTMTQNDIWLGIVSRTTTSGTNQFGGISNYVASDVTENFSGLMGVAQNATNQNVLGLGVYTATTTGIPGSVAFSQINGTNGLLNRVPLYYFLSQTA